MLLADAMAEEKSDFDRDQGDDDDREEDERDGRGIESVHLESPFAADPE